MESLILSTIISLMFFGFGLLFNYIVEKICTILEN